ncbi:MAG: hypothetical protein WC514_02475 [Candidatus Paceibacterota bacterium]
MKKALISLFLISFIAGGVFSFVPLANAANETGPPDHCVMKRDVKINDCPTSGNCDFESTKPCGVCCLMNALYTITDWVFIVTIAIVMLFVIMGAFTFVTSAGDPEKTKSGRLYITYAAIGLAIGLMARAVPGIVRMVIGVQG